MVASHVQRCKNKPNDVSLMNPNYAVDSSSLQLLELTLASQWVRESCFTQPPVLQLWIQSLKHDELKMQ